MSHQTNAQMDWTVLDILHYRPVICPRGLDSCISFHKGTADNHKNMGETNEKCSFLLKEDEDLEHIYVECSNADGAV